MRSAELSLGDRLGGRPGIARIVAGFFREMDARPEARGIRAMHAADTGPMVERLAGFLAGWLRGPSRPSQASVIPLAHFRFAIGPREVDAWLGCFRAALDVAGVDAPTAAELMQRIEPLAQQCRTDAESGPF